MRYKKSKKETKETGGDSCYILKGDKKTPFRHNTVALPKN